MEELVSISLPSDLFTLAVHVTFFTHVHCWLFFSLTTTQFVSILSRPGPAVGGILEYDIKLTNERQELAESNFDVWSVDTDVATKWEEIPHSTSANLKEAHEKEECRVSIHMDISRYKLSRVLCLYQDTAWGADLEGTSPMVEAGGKSMTINELASHIHPLTGFIVDERNSHVKGYLIDEKFYGSLRIFDARTEYHIHFFIEPLNSLKYYLNNNKTSKAQKQFSFIPLPTDNALMFEYIGFEPIYGTTEEEVDFDAELELIQVSKSKRNVNSKTSSASNNTKRAHGTGDSRKESKPTKKKGTVNGTSLKTANDNGEEDFHLLSPEIELLEKSKLDLAGNISIDRSSSKGDILDSTSETSALCKTCVWIETKFAEMFGFEEGALYGAAEIIETLSMMDWIFRSMDFNSDGISDNVGFILKNVVVSDEIDIKLSEESMKKKQQEHAAPKKNKRENFKSDKGEEGYAENQLNKEFEYFLPFEFDDNVYAADNYITENDERQAKGESNLKVRKVRQGERKKDSQEKQKAPPDTIERVNPQQAYSAILSQMHENPKFEGCCAMVAFVYADFSPSISVSTLRGLCSHNNLVLVSGVFHNHKITRFDILRALLHGFAHLLGAPHDKTLRAKCQGGKPSNFINPFITHPVHQINVGLRTNSFRMSPCAKSEVISFLNSNNPHCLEKGKGHYCGNGMLDDGEECDCGSLWQCHEVDCCGERDTVFGCKLNRIGKRFNCDRPQIW